MMASELDQINQIFQNFGIPLSMEWLESCIEWCKNDNLPPNYTLKNLQNMVYEQWLILDLRDVEIRSLPRNLSTEIKYSLAGVYYLQLMQVIDISKPKLWQLQRIRNKVAKNTESENDFGKRVLQLTLTDGVQEIEAMEFKPIACLNINITPGSKFKIIGPVMVRNGRLMLEPENVKILGGSVEDLVIKYAAENVLARALRLEENPNPHLIDENVLDIAEANTVTQQINHPNASTQNRAHINQTQPRNNVPAAQNVSMQNQARIQPRSNAPAAQNASSLPNRINNANINQEIPPEFQVDDELLRELEEDFEENSVRDFKKSMTNAKISTQSSADPNRNRVGNRENINSSLNNSNIRSSPDLFDHLDFDDEVLNKHLDHIDLEANKNITKGSKSESSAGHGPKNDDEIITLDDSFDDIDIDSHLDQLDEEMAKLPSSTQKIRDFKSPLLKQSTSLAKPATSKKLTQSKLAFGSSTASKKLPPTAKKGGMNLDDDIDDFEDPFSIFTKSQKRPPSFVPLDIPSVSKKLPNTSKSLPGGSTDAVYSPSPPKVSIMSIEKLKKLIPNVSNGKFKIKAKFQTVAERLSTTPTTFHLAISVTDDTGELTVKLRSDIVASFAQVTPEKLAEIKELVLQNDEQAKKTIIEALSALHRKCMALDNVLELQVTRGEKYPIVINVVEGSL